MEWSAQIFRYCERGLDPSFWAEPLNASTNLAYVVVASHALWRLALLGGDETRRRQERVALYRLVALVAAIGVGSFLFHTFATRWAHIADQAPIGLFMLGYLALVLRRFLGLGWLAVIAGEALFIAAMVAAPMIPCRAGLLGIVEAARGPCLNGTMGYAPALVALACLSGWLRWRGHATATGLLHASALLLAAMLFRTLDIELCPWSRLGGWVLGTHFLWHLVNAGVLCILLQTVIDDEKQKSVRLVI